MLARRLVRLIERLPPIVRAIIGLYIFINSLTGAPHLLKFLVQFTLAVVILGGQPAYDYVLMLARVSFSIVYHIFAWIVGLFLSLFDRRGPY